MLASDLKVGLFIAWLEEPPMAMVWSEHRSHLMLHGLNPFGGEMHEYPSWGEVAVVTEECQRHMLVSVSWEGLHASETCIYRLDRERDITTIDRPDIIETDEGRKTLDSALDDIFG